MGHLNSFSASGGGNLNKCPGGLPEEGMFKLRFDWYIISTLVLSRSRCKSPGPGCSKPD